MAEGIFSDLVARNGLAHCFDVASAGTVGYQQGCLPDPRAVAVSCLHGIDIASMRARCIRELDLDAFDWIFTMDNCTYHDVMEHLGPLARARVHLMRDFSGLNETEREIQDPYYGSEKEFERVMRELQEASESILEFMRTEYCFFLVPVS